MVRACGGTGPGPYCPGMGTTSDAAPLAVVGGQVLTELVDVTSDLAALDGDGWWAVVLPFSGEPVCARFASRRPARPWPGPPWPGVTGDIPFSAALDDLGEVFLARFEKGAWNYYSREQLGIPKGYIPKRDRVSRGVESASLQ